MDRHNKRIIKVLKMALLKAKEIKIGLVKENSNENRHKIKASEHMPY